MIKTLAVFVFTALAAGGTFAATIYSYLGPKYNVTGGSGYTTNMSITGSFTTSSQLPANLALTNIGPAGTNVVTAWSFNDGVNTFTKANSTPFSNGASFRVQTNLVGNINAFSITLMSPLPPHSVGQSIRFMSLLVGNSQQSQGTNGATCLVVTATVCTSVTNAPNYGDAFSGGAFAPVVFPLDVDASIASTRYDALTDGVLALRYLFGLNGTSLTGGALGAGATRTDPDMIKAYLASINTWLDIDGNGKSDALTDGLLILRYMFGLRGPSLIQGAFDPSGSRNNVQAIESQLLMMMP